MRVLVACEYSGTVRDAFLSRGHDAISCDILPTESPGPHYEGSALDLIDEPFDLVIAHPPCTYLANSGVQHLHKEPGRWALMREGARFFDMMFRFNAPRIAVENPVQHRYAKAETGRGGGDSVCPTVAVRPHREQANRVLAPEPAAAASNEGGVRADDAVADL